MAITGLNKGEIEVANDLIALKEKITAEMARRCYNITVDGQSGGSLEKYSKDPWLYTDDIPKKDIIPTAEQANKVIIPVNAVTPLIQEVTTGDTMVSLAQLEDAINTYSATEVQSEHNDCAGFCSGLCSSTCVGGCRSGCSGTCEGSCYTGCSGGCKNTCSGGCTGGCYTSCSGGCTGTCKDTCASCANGCANNCTGGCKVLCKGECTGCTGRCTGTCKSSCSGTCQGCGNNCVGQCTKTCTGGCGSSCRNIVQCNDTRVGY